MKTSEKERLRNRAVRSVLTKSIKSLKECQTKAEASAQINDVLSKIDKASQKNLIHKNKARRDKSKLVHFVSQLSD